MDKKAHELGYNEVVWYEGVGYQISWVDEYGVDARQLTGTGREFNHNAVADFKDTVEAYGDRQEAIFLIKSLLSRAKDSVRGLEKELERLEKEETQ